MKKIKLILLAVVLLTTVLLLASCGAKSFVDLVDREYTPVDNYPAYTTTTAVSALTDMTADTGAGDLKLFTKLNSETFLTKYVVYDVANDKVVWQEEETKSESATYKSNTYYNVSLYTIKESSYFTVTATTTNLTFEEGNSNPIKTETTKSVAIWAWNGSAYAELVKVTDPRGEIVPTQDLIYFEGKVYRADEETKAIAYAFDYSTLAKFPTLSYSTDNYYVARVDGIFITYDKNLKQISAFELPSYADADARIVIGDKLFIQYYVEEDMYGDNYGILLDSDEKSTLYTVLVDLETAKVKEIKTDYVVVDDDLLSSSKSWERYGFAALEKEVVALVPVVKVENKRIDESAMALEWAIINEKGDITVLEVPTSMPVEDFEFMAKDMWMLETVDGRVYLVNGAGEIKMEIDYAKFENSSMNYVAANGKLYDINFNEVLDYKAEKLTLVRTTPKAVMFTNADGELIIYANGQKTTLINKDAAKDSKRVYSNTYSSLYSGYFVIVDTTDAANVKYEIYNSEGKLIKTIDNTITFSISAVATAKDGAVKLVKITTRAKDADSAVTTYYRFT